MAGSESIKQGCSAGICNSCCTSCLSFMMAPPGNLPDPKRSAGPGPCPRPPWSGHVADLDETAFNKLDWSESDLVDFSKIFKTNHKRQTQVNRYPDIVPKRHSAVRLSLIDGRRESGYINASFIQGVEERSTGAYIAAQGPTEASTNSFWQMVWENGCTIIVMLTDLEEGGSEKCHQYWPERRNSKKRPASEMEEHQYGPLTVTNVSEEERKGGFRLSVLRLQRAFSRDGCHLDVHHYWFRSWKDNTAPGETKSCELLLREVQEQGGLPQSGPWVVHCSAGVGRTGCFLAIDHGSRLLKVSQKVDVLDIIAKLRKDRAGLVQTPKQARFARDVLAALEAGT